MRGEIGVQLRLGLKQAVNRDRCDRLSTCSTPSFPARRRPTRCAVAAEIT